MSPPVVHFPRVQKRPKLSLQTSELHISYGAASRNVPSVLAAPATTAITPTTFNTFSNTFELTHRPSPTSVTSSPSALRSELNRDRPSRPQSPLSKRQSDRAYTVSLPYGTKSILKNGPFAKVKTSTISASPRSSVRRVFFPAPKKVGFRNPIEEEIVTEIYVARHSDLFEGESQTQESSANGHVVDTQQTPILPSSPGHRSAAQKQHFSSVETRKVPRESNGESTATPVNSKKRRRWEWTLAPIPPSPSESSPEVGLVSEAPSGATPPPLQPKLELETRSCGSSPLMQKRAGSPEASPQKRKADCLESVDGLDSNERKRASTL